MNDYLSALHSRSAEVRSRAAVEAGVVHSLFAEPALRILVNDESPILISRGGCIGVGEVRFSALNALQRILLHHKKPIDLGELKVRKWMLADEVLKRFEAVPIQDADRVAAQVQVTLDERVQPEEDAKDLSRKYVTLQMLDLIEYRTERVDPVTYTTPLQKEVRLSQLVSARPTPHLRIADKSDPSRLFGYAYKGKFGNYVLDFAEGPGSDDAVSVLSSILQSPINEVMIEEGKTIRNADGSAKWGSVLDQRNADPVKVLQSLRVFVERNYDATISSERTNPAQRSAAPR